MLSSWGRFLELSDEEEGPLVIITTKTVSTKIKMSKTTMLLFSKGRISGNA